MRPEGVVTAATGTGTEDHWYGTTVGEHKRQFDVTDDSVTFLVKGGFQNVLSYPFRVEWIKPGGELYASQEITAEGKGYLVAELALGE